MRKTFATVALAALVGLSLAAPASAAITDPLPGQDLSQTPEQKCAPFVSYPQDYQLCLRQNRVLTYEDLARAAGDPRYAPPGGQGYGRITPEDCPKLAPGLQEMCRRQFSVTPPTKTQPAPKADKGTSKAKGTKKAPSKSKSAQKPKSRAGAHR